MRIVFIGPPGAGKGTQSARLTQQLGIAKLSSGDMLRAAAQQQSEIGRQAASYFQAGRLVPDDLVQQIVRDRLLEADCAAGYLLDGFPRTLVQAETLDRWLADQGQRIDAVVNLNVGEDELMSRLALRGRPDDDRQIVRQRLQEFERLTRPLLDYYRRQGVLHEIDGQASQDEVFNQILAVVGASSK